MYFKNYFEKAAPALIFLLALVVTGCGLMIRIPISGSNISTPTPTPSPAPAYIYYTNILQAGYDSICSVRSDTKVYCWGQNTSGQIGNGVTGGDQTTVTPVLNSAGSAPLTNIVATSIGTVTCAVLANGSLYCWGDNSAGQLAEGNTIGSSNLPVQISGIAGAGYLSNIVGVSSNTNTVVALDSNGYVYSWGGNGSGQVGNGTSGSDVTYPIQVLGVGGVGVLSGITQISTGSLHSCAVSNQGFAYCWGDNTYGEIGDNTSGTDRFTPVQVLNVSGTGPLSNLVSVWTRGYVSCAVDNLSFMYCWGRNNAGQLGNGSVGGMSVLPAQVIGPSGSGTLSGVSVIGGADHSLCAAMTSGNVYCWGKNTDGTLGNGTSGASTGIPTLVSGVGGVGNLSNIVGVAGGSQNADYECAIDSSNNVFCWGGNSDGQLGNGTTGGNQLTPLQVTGLP